MKVLNILGFSNEGINCGNLKTALVSAGLEF